MGRLGVSQVTQVRVTRLRVECLTGAINVDSVLKVLTSGENRASLANSGRAFVQGLVRFQRIEI
jgi:hypothetical protein